VFKQTSCGRIGATEPHSDWLFPRFQLLLPKPTERRSVYFCQRGSKLKQNWYLTLLCWADFGSLCNWTWKSKLSHLRLLALYRAPTEKFNQFIERLDASLKCLYNPQSEFLICGDINVDYLNDNNQKKQTHY